MIPFWWKYAAIGVAILALGLWIQTLRVEIAHQQVIIQQCADSSKQAAEKAQADAKTSKEVNDEAQAQLARTAGYLSNLLLERPSGVPAVPSPTSPARVDAGSDRQPTRRDNPATPTPIAGTPEQDGCRNAIGTALLFAQQVKLWRTYARETGQDAQVH